MPRVVEAAGAWRRLLRLSLSHSDKRFTLKLRSVAWKRSKARRVASRRDARPKYLPAQRHCRRSRSRGRGSIEWWEIPSIGSIRATHDSCQSEALERAHRLAARVHVQVHAGVRRSPKTWCPRGWPWSGWPSSCSPSWWLPRWRPATTPSGRPPCCASSRSISSSPRKTSVSEREAIWDQGPPSRVRESAVDYQSRLSSLAPCWIISFTF